MHRNKKKCKKKLFLAMIGSLGGPGKVNNFLSTLNIKPINQKNLKVPVFSVYQ